MTNHWVKRYRKKKLKKLLSKYSGKIVNDNILFEISEIVDKFRKKENIRSFIKVQIAPEGLEVEI
jgi:hypothetical protein